MSLFVNKNHKKKSSISSGSVNNGNSGIQFTNNPASMVIQRMKVDPGSVTRDEILYLQQTIGNQAVCQLLKDTGMLNISEKSAVKKETDPKNRTDEIKKKVENISGVNLGDIKVHYNSAEPSKLNAHAFTKGKDIYMSPGSEKHLPHEMWHAVQQKQGRVKATGSIKGSAVNTNAALEREADMMGKKALYGKSKGIKNGGYHAKKSGTNIIQAKKKNEKKQPEKKKNETKKGSTISRAADKIKNAYKYVTDKIADFKYANKFVGPLLAKKLSDDILGSLKAAVVNFAIGLAAAGLILGISTGLGAGIGALVGFFGGAGVGAAPGAAIGAKIGFEVGLFLLKWIGLGLLVAFGAKMLADFGIGMGKYIIEIFKANGDKKKLEESADICAEAMKNFLLGILEIAIMLVMAWGLGKAMGALAKSKFGKALGYDNLMKWLGERTNMKATKETKDTAKTKNSIKPAENFKVKINHILHGEVPHKITLKGLKNPPQELLKYEGKNLTPEILNELLTYEGKNGFNLDIVLKGNPVGGHFQNSPNIEFIEILENGPMGTIKAKIKIYDTVRKQWVIKKNPSSFFPKNWNETRIENEIISAYKNASIKAGTKWNGKSKSGLMIEGYIRDSELTGYPLF